MAWRGMASLGKASLDAVRQLWLGVSWKGRVRQGVARLGLSGLGKAVEARLVLAWRGVARLGSYGTVCFVKAWRG